MYIYHLTWAGFTLLILIWGQCEGLTTGISAERNFTPTSFFVSISLAVFLVNGDDGWQGSAGQHTYCVPSTQTPRCKPEKQKTTNIFIYYQTLLLTIKHFKRMKKHFLLLLLMTLLPLAGWATVRITVTLGTINKVYGEADPAVTGLDFSWTTDAGATTTEVNATNLLAALDYRRVSAGDEVNSVKYYTMVANNHKPDDWILVIANQGVINIMPKSLGTGTDVPLTGISIEDITGISYTGQAKTPDLSVHYDGALVDEDLEKDRDYTVEFTNNINKGTATATLTGKGNYEGTVTKTFMIDPGQFTAVFAETPNFTFSGENQTPTYTVMLGETPLTANTDYTVSYFTNADRDAAAAEQVDAKTYYVTVAGKAGTNYEGWEVKTLSYEIAKKSLADNDVTAAVISAQKNKTYKGSAYTFVPANLSVKFGDIALTSASYDRSYANNVNVGSMDDADETKRPTVIITGKGNYKDQTKAYFNILPRDLSDANVTISADLETAQAYKGSQITPSTEGKITFTTPDPDYTLVENTDYTVTYGNNINVADGGTITIQGIGNFGGDPIVKNFNITKVALNVNAKDFTKDLGNADPTSDALAAGNYYELTGFVNGETATTAEVTGAPTFAIAAHSEVAGTKEDVISIATVGTLSAANYSFAIGATADLIINKAGVAITVTDAEQTYGYKLPTLDKDAFAFTATGLLGAEEITGLTFTVKKGAIEYAKDDMLEAGEYDIIASDATATSGSYVFNYVAGTLTINKKAIKVVAKPQTVAYGGDAALDKDLLGGTTWSNTLVELQDTEGNTIGKTAFTNTYGIWKEDFVANLTWEAEDGYADKPIAHPGFIVANPADYNTDNWEVTFVPGAVTYSSVATDLTLTRVAKADIDVATVAADIATYDGCEHMNVTIKFNDPGYNTLKPNKWYAFILPFKTDVKMISDAFGYAIVDLLNEGNTNSHRTVFSLKMDNAEIPANTPFIVKVWESINMETVGVTFSDVKIEAPATYEEIAVSDAAGNQFIGSYTGINGLGAYKPEYSGHVLWWSLNQASENDNDARPASDTGYLRQMSAFSYVPDDVAAHEFIIEELGGNTTVIRGINIDGQNISAEGLYNMNGMKLNSVPTQKGVYIQNGKKVVIK